MKCRVWLRDEKDIEKIMMSEMPTEELLRKWQHDRKRWVIEEFRERRWVQVGGSSIS